MASRQDFRRAVREAASEQAISLSSLRGVAEAGSGGAAVEAAASCLDGLGFGGFALGTIGIEDDTLRGAYAVGAGPVAAAAGAYAERGLAARDTTLRSFVGTWRPSDLTPALAAGQPATAAVENLLDHGVRAAVLLPLIAGGGPVRVAAILAGGAKDDPEGFARRLRDHAWLARLALIALSDRVADLAWRDPGGLTGAERAVLSEVARGLRPREIAERLGKSERTVRGQIETARLRLAARTNAHAVAEAIRRGFILP